MIRSGQIFISVALLFSLPCKLCAQSDFKNRSYEQSTNAGHRTGTDATQDSALQTLGGRILQNYLHDYVIRHENFTLPPQSFDERKLRMEMYPRTEGFRDYTDSTLKQSGLRIGGPSSFLLHVFGKPDNWEISSDAYSAMTYFLHQEFGEDDKLIFFFTSDSLVMTKYNLGKPSD